MSASHTLLSLQDNRWPASYSLRENKQIGQEELQEEAGDGKKKED